MTAISKAPNLSLQRPGDIRPTPQQDTGVAGADAVPSPVFPGSTHKGSQFMHLSDLKNLHVGELLEMAVKNEVDGANRLRK